MVTAATRRDARERAIELLYEAESKDVDVADVVAALPLDPDPYALELAVGVTDHRIELDRVLARYAKGWNVSRMAVMDRTVMRLGAFELATKLDVPTGAALSEAVDLAGQYGSTDETSKYANGVLASVATEVRGGDRPWMPIDTVVFDLDGVIRHWDDGTTDASAQELGVAAGAIAAAAFAEPRFGDAMTGVLTAAEWAEGIGAELAADCGADPAEVAAVWLASPWTVDDAVVELIARLQAADVRLALFSNATDLLEDHVAEMGLSERFAVIGNSWRIGAAKPAAESYAAVADLLGCDPVRTLFVDDRAENVAGAVDAGWHAVQMLGVDRLVGVLRRLDVDGAADAS